MSIFLDQQPPEYRDAVEALLQAEVVPASLLAFFDFADQPLRMSNRNVPFTDLRWGQEWSNGAHVPVAIRDMETEADSNEELAPFREYQIGLPTPPEDVDLSTRSWAVQLVDTVRDRANYFGREASLWLQLFDPVSGAPVGWPSGLDTALMSAMHLSNMSEGAVLTLSVESNLARKGIPANGRQTFRDQMRRYPGDLGMEFTVESERVVRWTNW